MCRSVCATSSAGCSSKTFATRASVSGPAQSTDRIRRESSCSASGRSNSPLRSFDNKTLPEPVCQGSLISFEDKGRHVTLFLNPAGPKRTNGTLRMSLDGGKTWAHSRLLVPGPFAYSSMARLKDGRIAVIYEPNSNTEIRHLTVDLAWLEKGE